MGIEALHRKPNTSKKQPTHKMYSHLLRELRIDRVNRVWASDITRIPIARGWVYLCAIVDWGSRPVLSHRVSIGMDASFCVEALEEALAKYGQPEIFNSEQGGQFTGEAFSACLLAKTRLCGLVWVATHQSTAANAAIITARVQNPARSGMPSSLPIHREQ